MHELSLAMEVIELAQREAGKNGGSTIHEIRIEVGDLSGVEAAAFQSALELMVKDSILENAMLHVARIKGKGKCSACDLEFEMQHRLDSCPVCHCFPSEITGGQEFRVVSMVIDDRLSPDLNNQIQ